tara:strand:+ start:138 stop:284 length:147 start_codon:yes stop_codon:yes gene_type:complete
MDNYETSIGIDRFTNGTACIWTGHNNEYQHDSDINRYVYGYVYQYKHK